MKCPTISFIVFLLAVDSTCSLMCYECKNANYSQECDNPKPKTCLLHTHNICVKLTKARRMESRYECGRNITDLIGTYYNCEKYPDDCTVCHKDMCNKPDKEITQNSLKCYECYDGQSNDVSTFNDLESCIFKKEMKVRCYPNEQCVDARSNLDFRRYHGCVKDTKNFCTQHNFDNCTFCDKDLCNEVNNNIPFLWCYKCYSGKTSDKKFKNFKPCSHPEEVKCGHGLQCAAATDKLGERRYHDCGPISNKTDEFCEKNGFDECELCDEVWCNDPEKEKKNCYNCIFTDPNSIPVVTQFPKYAPNCSQPLISPCAFGSCLTLTEKENDTLIAAIHTCTKPTGYKKDCEKKGTHCEHCDDDLCNKVGNNTAIASRRGTSAAKVLKNDTISLLNLLFIFIIIRAAL